MGEEQTKSSVQQQSKATTFEEYLLTNGLIQKPVFDSFQSAFENDKSLVIERWLEAQKIMNEEEVVKKKAEFYELPYVDLREKQISEDAAKYIPKETQNFYNLGPFSLEGANLKVALHDPTNLQALQALEFLGKKFNLNVVLHISSLTSIDAILGRRKNLSSVVGAALEEFQVQKDSEVKTVVKTKQPLQENIEGAPIVRIVDVILSNAVEARASDIHIEPTDEEVKVRYRIDGVLHSSLVLPRHVHSAIVSRIKILTNLKIDESRLPQDGRFHVTAAGKSIDLRVSILPLIYGEKIVMRILDKSTKPPTLDDLGLRGKALEWTLENIKKTHGIFLITGPTGSGKSTTLYSILSMLNTNMVNIVTLEDPVEYFIPGVNQSQVNPEIGLTFAAGLRSILRQDPNIVMVGEIRDKETAELAVHAALTGHLVFSTLHTNDSVGAMPRLIDMEIEPFLLVASINAVMAQRLVRKVCENCIKTDPVPETLAQSIRDELLGVPPVYLENLDLRQISFSKGAGCEKCDKTGYKGRLGIYEVMPITNQVKDLVIEKAPSAKILEVTKKLGMITMRQDGIIKALRGETTLEEVARVSKE